MGFAYDTWGGSWGASWGNSWGVGTIPPVPPDTDSRMRATRRIWGDGDKTEQEPYTPGPTFYAEMERLAKEKAELLAKPAIEAEKRVIDARLKQQQDDETALIMILLAD